MKLIPLDAVLAEIEKLKAEALQKKSQCKRSGLEKIMHQIGAYNKVLSFIDTLEVKEVDLEKELSTYLEVVKATDEDIDFVDFAKHFFELGVKKSLTKDDVNKICQLFMEREAIERYFPDSIEWVYEQLSK